MSYTTLKKIDTNGDIVDYCDFGNSYFSGMLVWNRLKDKYNVETTFINYDNVWKLASDTNVLEHERIVLLSTFDRALCRSEDFVKLIDAFVKFYEELPEKLKRCTILAQAEKIKEMMEDKSIIGCAWQQTSVAEEQWEIMEGDDKFRPYNIFKDANHFWIFEELNNGKT